MDASQDIVALRARYVFPVIGPPIEGGIVTVRGQQFVAVGTTSDVPPIDLGNVAIVPGFVNAHTHLEFSDLERPLGEPGEPLPKWIRRVIAYRRDQAPDPALAIQRGLHESLASGTTTLGDIFTSGWLPSMRPVPNVVLFRELLGLGPEQVAPLEGLAEAHLLDAWDEDRILPGLSPHAPYSVHGELLVLASVLAAKYDVPLAMHLAESAEEIELLATGLGPFRELLEELHVWQDDVIPIGTGPIDFLRALVDVRRALIVHGNYLDDEAIKFLAEYRHRFAVVYCPRTHAYFKHAPYPLHAMWSAGVTMCVGTDSRASNPDLSLFEELRFIVEHHPQIAPREVLRFATFNGAQMLGDATEFGVLQPGAYANFAMIGLPDRTALDPHELLFTPEAQVTQTWWRGRRQCSV